MDSFSKNYYSKKLFKLQLTYDALKSVFENCCSYMDFYTFLQERGLNRKTAKYFACQFSGMGLKNQGSEPYSDISLSVVPSDETYDVSKDEMDEIVIVTKESSYDPQLPYDNTLLCEGEENWETEVDNSRSFTISLTKPPAPLSLTIDDFVSDVSSKKTKTSTLRCSKGMINIEQTRFRFAAMN